MEGSIRIGRTFIAVVANQNEVVSYAQVRDRRHYIGVRFSLGGFLNRLGRRRLGRCFCNGTVLSGGVFHGRWSFVGPRIVIKGASRETILCRLGLTKGWRHQRGKPDEQERS